MRSIRHILVAAFAFACLFGASKMKVNAQETTYKQGIDVSHHQGKIDWKKVKEAGIDFAIIRCGYGDDLEKQDDRYWEANIKGCEENGIPYGIYIYSYAKNSKMVESEVRHTLRLIEKVGAKPTYPVYYDLEDDSIVPCGREAIIQMANQYCSAIEAAGYQAGIYANTYWWNTYLNDTSLDAYEKWVAQWAELCEYEGYYRLWQYTERGTIAGVAGYVDMNYQLIRQDISGATVQMEEALTYTYDGTKKCPTVSGVVLPETGQELIRGQDYEVYYVNNVLPGTGIVKVAGRGNYEGQIWVPFSITGPQLAPIKEVTAQLHKKDAVLLKWSGQSVSGLTVQYKVEVKKGGESWKQLASTTATSYKAEGLQEDTKYVFRVTPYLSLQNYTPAGEATESTSVRTLKKVKLQKVKKASKTKVLIQWKHVSEKAGYEIAVSKKKSKGYQVVKTVGKKKNSVKIKAQRYKKLYYKVRAYQLVNGKKVYGAWSAPITYKLK